MFGLGMQELLLIFAIAALFFGGKKIPELAKGLGQGLREFKQASTGQGREDAAEHEER